MDKTYKYDVEKAVIECLCWTVEEEDVDDAHKLAEILDTKPVIQGKPKMGIINLKQLPIEMIADTSHLFVDDEEPKKTTSLVLGEDGGYILLIDFNEFKDIYYKMFDIKME